MARTRNLSDVLLEEELISADDLEKARHEAQRRGRSLGRVLIDLGMFTEAGLVKALAIHLGLEFVELEGVDIDHVAASKIPEHIARRYCVFPFGYTDDGDLKVAMADPSNVIALDDIRTICDAEIQPVVASRADITAQLDKFGGMGGDSMDALAGDLQLQEDDDLEDLDDAGIDDAPIVKFVNALISQAVGDRASDIHIEPTETEVRVRYRIDGVLHEITSQTRKIHAGVVSRLKIMADLDIAERRIPQDGRISLMLGKKKIDLRVSTLPTVYGEKVVMRILDKSSIMLDLTDLGFTDHNYEMFSASFRKPYGLILVTGPTGSGKSTSLYATLNKISKPEINIVTTEDPVEYRLPGISQVQVNKKAGLTFEAALRSILRQDPDVILVGEMRDHETAQIGLEAALTGHLVLSTLHTNDAPSAVTRLTEMGIDPFLVSSAADCVLAQRLARRLCSKCKTEYRAELAELQAAGLPVTEDDLDRFPPLMRAVGCAHCGGTGYRGRLAIHEVMQVSEEIERLIVTGASTDEIAKTAQAQGMRTLREDGLHKVVQGITTLEEIGRVVV
ncbi:GspE/PulE family protein [Euzebya tangerina]|uniref:GspE/PulE family protein n=1 Tax=Euzebya tangerina TaxID=591198 RepID=UPI000E3124FB|nr:ATPase, T2SS/T4P/T4SS family [Euzebya tangerina]